MTENTDVVVIEEPNDIEIVGRHARIITRGRVVGGGAIYHRAKIIRETENAIIVTFVSKSDPDRTKVVVSSEMIKKIDIVSMTLFKE